MRKPILCVVACVLAGGCGGPKAAPPPEARHFITDDGVRMGATLYRPAPAAGAPPGLILVHRQAADRGTWAGFADTARQAGYLVLAIDLRGHGESTLRNGQLISYLQFRDEDWRDALHDLDAAKRDLLAAGASPKNMAVAGEGAGASLALGFAAIDPQMQAAVLLSPGLDHKGLHTESVMKALRDLPVLLIAADGDSYAASSAQALKALAPGFCELRSFPGSAHGTDLFAVRPDLAGEVLLWLKRIIG
jgi:alpha-beta hydrolase superfamily lysophospholipase